MERRFETIVSLFFHPTLPSQIYPVLTWIYSPITVGTQSQELCLPTIYWLWRRKRVVKMTTLHGFRVHGTAGSGGGEIVHCLVSLWMALILHPRID